MKESKYSKYAEYIKENARKFNYSVNKLAYRIAKMEGRKNSTGAIRDYVAGVLRGMSQINQELNDRGIDSTKWDIAWIKTDKGSYRLKKDIVTYSEVREELKQELKEYSPNFPIIERQPLDEPHLLIIDPADPHIGKVGRKEMTGEENSTDITVERLLTGVEKLLRKAKNHNIEKIILVIGNDALHIDSNKKSTTAGTLQDTDKFWWEIFRIAKDAYKQIIEMCISVADTHVVYCPSNHDYHLGFALADVLEAYFTNSKNVSFDVSPAIRKYVKYGVNMIGFTHGDWNKWSALPDLMKTEAKQAWATSKVGYWYVHHIHHKDRRKIKGGERHHLEKEYSDVTVLGKHADIMQEDRTYVEYVRSISGTDTWHANSGYLGQKKALEAFIHHPIYGQTDRLTVIF